MNAGELNRPLRILVVDDDDSVRSTLLDFLEIRKYEADSARNGREAIRLLDGHHAVFDLLITDICMPEMDGFGLIQHVRKRDESLPILAITGYADNAILDNITRLGIPVFTKPLNFVELEQRLLELIPGMDLDSYSSDNSTDTH